ncbi:phage portal protein [Rhodovulum sp. DZ06]|uniref:phage portal protein n=1 Tax=Rhodovulum sp. DZ06 TaxID=3425126 RepID=UPI003D33013B
MTLLRRLSRRSPEARASIESPTVPVSSAALVSFLGLGGASGVAGKPLTLDAALGVPAVWGAVNFLARTMAALPLHVYRRGEGGARERVRDGIGEILGFAPNEETTSYDWRKEGFDRLFTEGRALSFIERNAMGEVINLWPMEPSRTTVLRGPGGRKRYELRDGAATRVYAATEVLDLPFMLGTGGLTARSPIFAHAADISLMVEATQYAGRWFRGGGVPPFLLQGKFVSGAALKRASDDLTRAVEEASAEGRAAVAIPEGHEVKSIGGDPSKSQMIEAQRWGVEQVARIYGLPPAFLQDLTHGTFSNTEQQDLQLAKHVVAHWARQMESQINLKVFGRGSDLFAEFNLDGLMRGDFASRMEGYAKAIQNGILTPNEGRAAENRPPKPGGDQLLIQGATVPLGMQAAVLAAAQAAGEAPEETGESDGA